MANQVQFQNPLLAFVELFDFDCLRLCFCRATENMDHTFHTPSFGDEEFSIPQFNHLGAANEAAANDYHKAISPTHYQNHGHWNNEAPVASYAGYNHVNHHQQSPHLVQSPIHHPHQQPVAVQQTHPMPDQEPPMGTTVTQLYGRSPTGDGDEINFANNKNKRPSPGFISNNEAEDGAKTSNAAKKAKVVKKKAKKDPNEPQK